jgi:hypothetical protein
MREIKEKKHFFRARPDGITHHNENRIWYLMEFKHTSDVLPDYLERKDSMTSKQYENFMNILRKAKKPGWTSDQLNFIVDSKSINENVMDTNLERLGINQKNKKEIKPATGKTNIHSLFNILKAYYANTHQDPPESATNEGAVTLQLAIDTRQDLGKRPPYANQDPPEPPTRLPPSDERHAKRPSSRPERAYTSLMPQVNYTEGTAPDNPPRPPEHSSKPPAVPHPNTPHPTTRSHLHTQQQDPTPRRRSEQKPQDH